MDLATVLARVDGRQYQTIGHYLADLALIIQVWVCWGGENGGGGRRGVRSRRQGGTTVRMFALAGGDSLCLENMELREWLGQQCRKRNEAT